MKRLIRKISINKESNNYESSFSNGVFDNDIIRGIFPSTPPYGSQDSYSNYVNQDPNNKYIKRLIDEPPTKDFKTFKDVLEEYLKDDNFTFKQTK